jgi:hypothetical protein
MENPVPRVKRLKYKSFTQQIAEISADITNAYELQVTAPSGGQLGTYFAEYLHKSVRSHLDPAYAVLSADLLPISRTLPLVLHNKDQIFDLLLSFLGNPFDQIPVSLIDVLKLIAALARDLRPEFYPHFADILVALATVLDRRSPDLVQGFFETICFLFKFLLKPLIQDFDNVLRVYVTCYVTHEHEFARRVGAESLAFRLRRGFIKKFA